MSPEPKLSVSYNRENFNKFDREFCLFGKKYGIKKLVLKSMAICESALDDRAYRYEPKFWNQYLKDKDNWSHRDPAEVSASYGLMQLMYSTAHMLGFRGSGEELYQPVYNIELGAKFLRRLLNKISLPETSPLWPIEIALARYNGGVTKNPDEDGKLRSQKYANKILRTWAELKKFEDECTESD